MNLIVFILKNESLYIRQIVTCSYMVFQTAFLLKDKPIVSLDPNKLEDHPLSKELFGDLPPSEYGNLKEDIDSRGIQDPLHVVERNKKYIVVSGHQRKEISKELKRDVPCIIRDDLKEDWQIEEQLIKDNFLRRHLKDWQIPKIAKHILEIEKKRAIERMSRGGKKGAKDFTPLIDKKKPKKRATDEVAKHFNKVSGRQLEKMLFVDDKASKDIKEKWKQGEITTHQAYTKTIRLEENKQVEQQKVDRPLPEGLYSVILADPPWRSDFSPTTGKRVQRHYPTMSLEEIKGLEIPSTDDAMLFLWTTAPMNKKALDVMEAWGFDYRSQFVWDKEIIGTGFYVRGQHELLLLGKKGKGLALPKPNDRHSSVIRKKRYGHSKKPDIVYEIIERMYPNQKYVELFARDKRKGWVSWSNEP